MKESQSLIHQVSDSDSTYDNTTDSLEASQSLIHQVSDSDRSERHQQLEDYRESQSLIHQVSDSDMRKSNTLGGVIDKVSIPYSSGLRFRFKVTIISHYS